jgi:hypothetical protein
MQSKQGDEHLERDLASTRALISTVALSHNLAHASVNSAREPTRL